MFSEYNNKFKPGYFCTLTREGTQRFFRDVPCPTTEAAGEGFNCRSFYLVVMRCSATSSVGSPGGTKTTSQRQINQDLGPGYFDFAGYPNKPHIDVTNTSKEERKAGVDSSVKYLQYNILKRNYNRQMQS